MNEFNTKLIELLERIAGSIQCQPDERVIELFKELKEMNEQEIKQEQAIKPFLQSCPLKSLKTHDRELVKEVCEKIKLEFDKLEQNIINQPNIISDEYAQELIQKSYYNNAHRIVERVKQEYGK